MSEIRKTFVVFGNFRGGTSMVAKTLTALGVFMGYRKGPGNEEDLDFQGCEVEQLIQLIESRNKSHNIWGWKYPNSIIHVDSFHSHLINPHYICIFRDPVAVALSEQRRAGQPFNQMLNRTIKRNKQMMDFFRLEMTDKILLLSYEHCVTRTDQFAQQVVEFVGLGVPSDVSKVVSISTGGNDYYYPY